jgi:hypothetical protein
MADHVLPAAATAANKRFERLSNALRDNLRKRKKQTRERDEHESEDGGDDPSVVPKEVHITDIEA